MNCGLSAKFAVRRMASSNSIHAYTTIKNVSGIMELLYGVSS